MRIIIVIFNAAWMTVFIVACIGMIINSRKG